MAAVLIDLDGVVYEGATPVAGAAAAVEWLRARKIAHLFLTNTTSRPRRALVDKLAGFGIHADMDEIFTPCVAAVRWMRDHGLQTPALFVPEATAMEFSEFTALAGDAEQGADVVVVGDLGQSWDFARLNRAFRLLMADPTARLAALGMTRYWRAEDGLRLDTAPFVKALAYATGIEPTVLGKPAPEFFRAALQQLGATAQATFMVGDDIRTDIDGAQAIGMRGILVRTGKFRPEDLESGIAPAAVLRSIADLPDWWHANVLAQ